MILNRDLSRNDQQAYRGAKLNKNRLLTRATALLSSVALLFSIGTIQNTHALDGQQMGQISSGLGMGMMGMAMADTAGSGGDCLCMMKTPPTPCPKPPAGFCVMMGLNIAAAIAAMIPTKTGANSASKLAGFNGVPDPNTNFDPNTNLTDQFCSGSHDPMCDCSGANASTNILCGPAAIKNVQDLLNANRDKITNGSMAIPDGTTAADMLAGIDKASSGLSSLLDGKIPGVDTGDLGASMSDLKEGGGGKTGYDTLAGGSDSSGGFDAFGLKGKAGPNDRTGLGKISYANGLDVVDEATGKSLTIWQRLTRRMQGDGGSRAYLMAKVEYIRKHTAPTVAVTTAAATEKVSVAPPISATSKPAAARAPASLSPKH